MEVALSAETVKMVRLDEAIAAVTEQATNDAAVLMKAMAKVRRDTLEEAAKIAESEPLPSHEMPSAALAAIADAGPAAAVRAGVSVTKRNIAAAIRALKGRK
jgi:hypothetical protein